MRAVCIFPTPQVLTVAEEEHLTVQDLKHSVAHLCGCATSELQVFGAAPLADGAELGLGTKYVAIGSIVDEQTHRPIAALPAQIAYHRMLLERIQRKLTAIELAAAGVPASDNIAAEIDGAREEFARLSPRLDEAQLRLACQKSERRAEAAERRVDALERQLAEARLASEALPAAITTPSAAPAMAASAAPGGNVIISKISGGGASKDQRERTRSSR